MKFAATAILLLIFANSLAAAHAAAIPTVPVGNAGNPSDSNGLGSVPYDYRIGATEVTNAQYAEFLNAKAASDPHQLYDPLMGSAASGGIIRSGSNGSYVYTLKPNMDNKPVNFVVWFDAIRFANWLNNGQGAGDTESGAYTLTGNGPFPPFAQLIERNPGAVWFLPNQDEWYKAAYYQPADQGGDIDSYWSLPTATNTSPTPATADAVGNISNPGPNVANYKRTADWNGENGNVTSVGSAGPLSESYFGTSDQGGNVAEWTESLVESNKRVYRGGEHDDLNDDQLHSWWQYGAALTTLEDAGLGFRVAAIPEPSTYALAAVGMIGLLLFQRRK
jgi:formylglycine-generating enzyme required for sulfatase activity